ncbi:hypothetical protein EVAR_14337_1 [Eumeta japonica]|uniref:Uncharacterized protein n=1 Tax=Eumeta variegata TaxID=151549 RepID=A0A4C1UM56_EUMVA|nr:hypothetical protein EVAR_14337_1 [Eumeta japonica]
MGGHSRFDGGALGDGSRAITGDPRLTLAHSTLSSSGIKEAAKFLFEKPRERKRVHLILYENGREIVYFREVFDPAYLKQVELQLTSL